MITQYIFRLFVIIFTVYLIWVWNFDTDESSIPFHVVQLWMQQPMPHWILSNDILLHVYSIRHPLAYISLALLFIHNNFGKWGFLIFSISGPLLNTEGWVYQMSWVMDLEWTIQMMQGALIAMCFIGPVSEKFTWKFNKKILTTTEGRSDKL